MAELVHQASVDADSGRVVFVFAHGDHRLVGQVPAVDEYKACRVLFESWAGVKLPRPTPVENLPDEWPEGVS